MCVFFLGNGNITTFFFISRYGVSTVILDPVSSQAHNIVAAINVGPTYHARVASPVSIQDAFLRPKEKF